MKPKTCNPLLFQDLLESNRRSSGAQKSRLPAAFDKLSRTRLTQTLKAALSLVDVRVLDHLVIAGNASLSFAERGLI